MNKYDISEIGNIVVIKGIIFNNNVKAELDHAWSTGRPCLIIAEDPEFYYFLTLTSNERTAPKYMSQYYKLDQDSIEYIFPSYKREENHRKNKNKKREELKGFVNLANVYKMPAIGLNGIGKLKFDVYKDIIEKFKEYQKNNELGEILSTAENIKR